MEVSVPRESDPSTSKAPSPYFDIQVWEKMSMMQIPGDGEKMHLKKMWLKWSANLGELKLHTAP
jgi:hypothetical protein